MKTAIVTGGGGYIGGAVCEALAKRGDGVAVCDISLETAEQTVKRIQDAGGIARAYKMDVTDSANVNEVVAKIREDFGSVDISIHVAGGSARIAGPGHDYHELVDQDDFVIDRVLKVNLYGAFYLARAAARIMIEQGRGGKIISFSSIVGMQGLRRSSEYAAAKGGVIAMTKALAKELGKYKINVNSVAPGVVQRPGVVSKNPNYAYGTNFLKEKCLATDIANVTEFLASEKANFVTGQTYVVDGGRSLAMKGSELD